MHIYNLTNEHLEEEVTGVKDIVIHYLYKNGHITAEVYKDMRLNHAVIIRKPSFFSKWWKSIINKTDNVPQYVLVKQVSLIEPDKDKNKEKLNPKLNIVNLGKNKKPEKE